MEGVGEQGSRRRFRLRESIGGWTISCIVTLVSQLSLLLVPLFSPSSSLLSNLFFSGVVLLIVAAVAKVFKRLLKLRASAPALVFFNILFVWFVYLAVFRQVLSSRSILFNGGLVLLVFGFFRILRSDPGLDRHKDPSLDELMHNSTSEAATHGEEGHPSRHNNLGCETSFEGGSFSLRRVRYCSICKDYVRGFDHHCPAFGNCIVEKNHILFMTLLFGFITMEGLYIMCTYDFARPYKTRRVNISEIISLKFLAISTMFFCLQQLLWQVVFLAWHIYCICSNIRTEEWINWKRYPEFQLTDHSSSGMTFTNPYDKGILNNLKEFLSTQH